MNALRGWALFLLLTVPAVATAAPPTGPGSFTSPPPPPTYYCPAQRPMPGDPPQGPPSLCQQHADTQVPTKHGACGDGCKNHVLAAPAPGIKVALRLDFRCPPSAHVRHASYQLKGKGATVLVGADTGQETFSKSFEVQPFSAAEVTAACQQALGGSWKPAGKHRNAQRTVATELRRSIEVSGQCAAGPLRREYLIRVPLSCEDESF